MGDYHRHKYNLISLRSNTKHVPGAAKSHFTNIYADQTLERAV